MYRILLILFSIGIFISCDDNSNPLKSEHNNGLHIILGAGYSTSNFLLDKNIETGEIDTLLNDFQLNSPAIWASTGDKFLIVSKNNIYSYDFSDNNFVQITDSNDCYGLPSWSPLGDQFTYTSVTNTKSSLAIISADGSNQKHFSSPDFRRFYEPVWSPLGRTIVFMAIQFQRNLFQFNIVDSTITQFFQTDGDKLDPSWSPDGEKIAYAYSSKGIYVVNIDGSNNKQLTQISERSRYPIWSPDGTKISYSQRGSEGLHKYYYYDLSLNKEILIDDSLDNYVLIGSWSKDSKLVSYSKKYNNKQTVMIYNIESKKSEEIIVGHLSIFTASFKP